MKNEYIKVPKAWLEKIISTNEDSIKGSISLCERSRKDIEEAIEVKEVDTWLRTLLSANASANYGCGRDDGETLLCKKIIKKFEKKRKVKK